MNLVSTYINYLWPAFKAGLIAFAILYFIFTLIVLRQVKLLTETILTQTSPGLRLLSIFYSAVALAVVVLFVWILT